MYKAIDFYKIFPNTVRTIISQLQKYINFIFLTLVAKIIQTKFY